MNNVKEHEKQRNRVKLKYNFFRAAAEVELKNETFFIVDRRASSHKNIEMNFN